MNTHEGVTILGQQKSDFAAKRKNQCIGAIALILLLATGLRAADLKTVIFFGDSLTAGYGVDPDEAFPALIQQKIDAAGLPWRVVNAGLSGETSAGGLRRLDWVLRQPVDLFVIELGGNDGLRGIAPANTKANLAAMVERIRERAPGVTVVIAGLQMPTNMGPAYTAEFASLYPDVARAEGAVLIPFLLEGVGGVPTLNLPDGIHPTPQGHRVVAEIVWRTLKPLL